MVIYHAVRPLPARIAAALHLHPAGDAHASPAFLLPDLARESRAADLLRPQAGMRLEGVDPAGTPVYSCATGAAPEVVERAFAGMARVCGIPASAYRLVAVEEPAWVGAVLAALGRAGAGWALGAYARLAGRAAAEAVRRTRGSGGAGA